MILGTQQGSFIPELTEFVTACTKHKKAKVRPNVTLYLLAIVSCWKKKKFSLRV